MSFSFVEQRGNWGLPLETAPNFSNFLSSMARLACAPHPEGAQADIAIHPRLASKSVFRGHLAKYAAISPNRMAGDRQ
jgi:hypothetical protein